jgi:hypothetical protein
VSQPIRLGELLVRAGVVTDLHLQAALAEQQRWGGRLGSILVRMGALSEDLLVKALSKQLGIPRADLDNIRVPDAILAALPREVCEQLGFLPMQYVSERKALVIALADPSNVSLLDDLSRRVRLKIEPMLAGESQIRVAIARLYAGVGHSENPNETALRLVNNLGDSIPEQAPVANRGRVPTFVDIPAVTSGLGPNVDELLAQAQRQARAMQLLVDLLIERGVVTREELAAWLSQA